ncbi:MAG: cytidine deaminase [Pseudomonadota bacterium]
MPTHADADADLAPPPPPRPTSIGAPTRLRLLAAARATRRSAHAPYSHFLVGAAVLDERGRVHVGCNVENASYGLTICAERNAVGAAVAAGARRIRAVAVITAARPAATPCGACRQVLAELGSADTLIMLARPTGATTDHALGALLPATFSLIPPPPAPPAPPAAASARRHARNNR